MSMILKFTDTDSMMEVIPNKYRVSFLIKNNEKQTGFTVRLNEIDVIF